MRQETINLKLGNIAQMSGLRLDVDNNAAYGGWQIFEPRTGGGESTSKFGNRRRPYGEFIDYLDAITLGLVLAGQNK